MRGGKRKGAGRPALPESQKRKTRQYRLTDREMQIIFFLRDEQLVDEFVETIIPRGYKFYE